MKNSGFEFNFDEALLKPSGDEIVRVIYTMPLNEGRFRLWCVKNGFTCYLPLKKVCRFKRQTHGSKTYNYQSVVLRPMFPSYAFVKTTPDQLTELFRSNCIVRVLGDADFKQEKLISEIRTIQRIETIAMDEQIEFNASVKIGDRFLITSGPWEGIYGWLKDKRKSSLWTVEIECVNSMVQATIDPSKYKMVRVED